MKDNAFNTTFESLGGHLEALKRPQSWCHILCELHFLERGPRWVPRNEEVQRQLDAYIELHKTAAKQVGPSKPSAANLLSRRRVQPVYLPNHATETQMPSPLPMPPLDMAMAGKEFASICDSFKRGRPAAQRMNNLLASIETPRLNNFLKELPGNFEPDNIEKALKDLTSHGNQDCHANISEKVAYANP